MKKLLAVLLTLMVVMCAFVACTDTPDVASDANLSSDASASDANIETPVEDEAPVEEAPVEDEAPVEETPAVESDLQYILDKGTLVVGITDFAPMDYQDEEGNWIGFDADMAKAFAEYLGVNVQFQIIDWDNKVMELDSKAIDVVWNGMTLTEEVKAAMECSNAYCNNAQVVILPADVAANYADAESVAALMFAVEAGSAGEAQAAAYGYATTPVLDQATALLEVKSGTADAAIIDSLMAGAMVGEGTSYADLATTEIKLNSEEYGVGFRKGSDAAAKLNEFFAAAYADTSMVTCAETYGVQAALIAQ